MTDTPSELAPTRDIESVSIESASIDELERMLADAERNIHALHKELAERRAEMRSRQFDELPDDISVFEGSWRSIIRVLRDSMKKD